MWVEWPDLGGVNFRGVHGEQKEAYLSCFHELLIMFPQVSYLITTRELSHSRVLVIYADMLKLMKMSY